MQLNGRLALKHSQSGKTGTRDHFLPYFKLMHILILSETKKTTAKTQNLCNMRYEIRVGHK